MRRLTTPWLLLLVTPLIALSFARTVRADPISYSTSGEVGAEGSNPVGNYILDATSGTLLGSGSLALATFQAPTVPTGATLTFTNMPFFITVDFQSGTPKGNTSALTIQGELNGTITSATSSNVVATATSIQSIGVNALPFSLSNFNVLTPQTLAPGGIDGGATTLIGQVTAMSTPEPTPLALLGILAVGAVLRSGIRRIQRRS
jgi:hypothetical protein